MDKYNTIQYLLTTETFLRNPKGTSDLLQASLIATLTCIYLQVYLPQSLFQHLLEVKWLY